MPLMSKSLQEKRTLFKIKLGLLMIVLGGVSLLIHFGTDASLDEMLPGSTIISYHQATYQVGIILFLSGIILACFNAYIKLMHSNSKNQQI